MTVETIQVESKTVLEQVEKKYGFVPNVLKEISLSPVALQVYLQGQALMEGASLNNIEQGVIQYIISLENDCNYCSVAHKALLKMEGMAVQDLEILKSGGKLQNNRLQILVDLTRLIIDKQGWLTTAELASFESRQVTRRQVVEIVTLIGLKTITNYVNHMVQTPLDEQFEA